MSKDLTIQQQHERFMRQCLDLAKVALAAGDPPVGAILIFNGEVIGTGIESGKSTGDITNHAEIMAVRNAIANGNLDKLNQSTMYTTHEPCVMCSYLIRHHRIPEIVYGVAVSFTGGATSQFNILSTQDIPKWGGKPNIVSGICLDECEQLNQQFAKTLI